MMDTTTTPNRRKRSPSHESTRDTKIQKDAAPQTPTAHNISWYRISFSCRHTGRYVASSKRRTTWRFGSIKSIKAGLDQYEEHEVVLVWSVKSGKSKLVWNGQDISRLFRETRRQKPPPSCLEFAWETSRGDNFKAVANLNSPGQMNQYDFLINDESFFSMPAKEKAVGERVEAAEREMSPEFSVNSEIFTNRVERAISGDLTGSCGDDLSGDGMADPSAHSRLASAGFSYNFDMEDELRSDLYSVTLDVLRDVVSSFVPETEEMMSRAIINAFSEDHDSDTSGDSLSLHSDRHLDPAEVEADVLGETFEWLKWSRDFISAFDMHDRKLEFMQKHVEQMVAHVRHERLEPTPASLIMHRVAAVLKLEVTREPNWDTVMFSKLNSLTTSEDIIDAMRQYGDVTEAAVSRNHEGFGFCRFANADTIEHVCMSAIKGGVVVNGRNPEVFGLFESPYSKEIEDTLTESREKEYDYDCYEEVEGYNQDLIDPSDDCIEATYNSGQRGSMCMSPLRPPTFTQNSFESSASSNIHSRSSFKNSSSGTIASLSSLDDLDPASSSFISMAVLD